jgi:hypothetical protein
MYFYISLKAKEFFGRTIINVKKRRLFTLLVILTLALSTFFTCNFNLGNKSVFQTALANTYPKSNHVAMVPDNWAWNGTSSDGGGLYVGTSWPNGDSFTFSNVSVGALENGNIANPLSDYDTVVLWATRFKFGEAWSNSTFRSNILNFTIDGGKLIIYVSEIDSSNSENANAFTNFIYPFTINSPGHTGSSSGNLTNYVNETLSSTNPADASYISLTRIVSQTDIGDATVMVSRDGNWSTDLFAVNVNNVGGPVHAYAFYGVGLIIFNGLDYDRTPINGQNYKYGPITPPTNGNGTGAQEMLWWRELSAQNLGASVNVNGLTLSPGDAVNPVNTSHVVTAKVRNMTNNSPISGVPVNFTIISGPNTNLTGYGTTNSNGETTFNWSSSVVGIDTLQATIPNSIIGNPPISSIATKTWVIPGPLAVSVSPSNWTMDFGQSSLLLTATPNGGSLNYTRYQWYLNGSAMLAQTLPTYTFTPNATGLYLIAATVTDSVNTTSPPSNATITVNTYPNVTITPVGPLTMETGATQLFLANATGGSVPIHYQWNVSAVNVGVDNSNYTFTAGSGSANITCTITDSASVPVSVVSNTVLITVNGTAPTPTPTSSSSGGGGDSSGSSGSSDTSTSTKTNPTPTPTDTPSPTPTPTPPDQYPTPVFTFTFGWVEIAIISLLAVVLVVIIIAVFRSFK